MQEQTISSVTPTADIVFINGRVITVNRSDEVTEALAVRDNRLLRVGSRPYVEQTIGRDTRVIDLAGRALIPGMIENHIHMTNTPQRHRIDCSYPGCKSVSDVVERIAARACELPPGEWILARGYQPSRLAERRDPTRLDLDPVTPQHPVAIVNREGMGWTFNTLGLCRIGVRDDCFKRLTK